MKKRAMALWGVYGAFVACVFYAYWHDAMFQFGGELGAVKLLVWLVFVAFVIYSFYCSQNENLFRTIGVMARLHWGRQIGLDLYLGLTVALLLIYLNDGFLVTLLWLLPVLAFANLAVLLYLAVNFDRIVNAFLV